MSKKVICIEGADNIGKTTLCQMLLRTIEHAQYFHLGAPKEKGEKALDEQIGTLNEVLNRIVKGDGVEIWDRSVIGEAVYGPMYRDYNHYTYWKLLAFLKNRERNVLFIVMYADPQTYAQWKVKAKQDEAQQYQQQSHAQKISVKFVDVATKLDLENTIYVNCNNYSTMDERNEYVIKRVRRWLAQKAFEYTRTHSYAQSFFNIKQRCWVEGAGFVENRYDCRMFKDHECAIGEDHRELIVVGGEKSYPIGAVGAINNVKFIFIGEASGYQPNQEQLLIPFYNGASGCIFQAALDRCHIHPTQYYLTNIVKCNPKGNKLLRYVGHKTDYDKFECVKRLVNEVSFTMSSNKGVVVVAIGKIAAEQLGRLGITHRTIYHPAYYNRIGESWRFAHDLYAIVEEGQ